MRASLLAAALFATLTWASTACDSGSSGGEGGSGGSGGRGNADPGPYTLTVSGAGYSPHVTMHAALFDETLSMVTVRLPAPAQIADGRFSYSLPDALVAGHTYRLDQFAELASDPSPNVCDSEDHRWSDAIAAPTKDVVLTVSHRTDNFSDLACSSFED
jgi:hypothetical protein